MKMLYPNHCIYCGTRLESLLVRNNSEQCPKCFKELRDLDREITVTDKDDTVYYEYVDEHPGGYHQICEKG